jgi:nitroreductase
MTLPGFIPYRPTRYDERQMRAKALETYQSLDARRSVRHFSEEPVPRELIEIAIKTASTAPSGAHRQPWKFVAVSDPAVKHQIRVAAEKEERQSYEGGRMPPEWLEALRPLGTDWHKGYLETVPWIVVVFEETYRLVENGQRHKNYYVKESVGIASGMFIVALHEMGLATLTHTPSPMNFLSEVLGRPENERPFILFPIGFPASDAEVPDLCRRPLAQISEWIT